MKKILQITKKAMLSMFVALVCFGFASVEAQNIYYLHGNQNPWGQGGKNVTAFNNTFGGGNWIDGNYETTPLTNFFNGNTCFIMMEGSDGSAIALNAVLNANRGLIESWVNSGGSLFMNSAGNNGGDINYGFGGVTNRSYQGSGTLQPSATVVSGTIATTPNNVGVSFSGNFFGHGYITGPGMTNLINGSGPSQPVLTAKSFGSGHVLFGNMTTTNWHSPQPNADRLRENILDYGAAQCAQVCVPTLVGCPASINTDNDNGLCGANVSWNPPTIGGGCPGVTLTASHSPGSFFPQGNTVVTYTLNDPNGPNQTCTFSVVVSDDENPVLTCPNFGSNNDPGICGAVVNFADPTGTDNCPGVFVVQTNGLPSGSTFPVGISAVEFTAIDASGNNTSCTFNVTVSDVENPNLTCPANINANNDPGVCGAAVTYAAATATDNCPGVFSFQTSGQASGSTFPVGISSVSFTAVDASGNNTSCSFNITVSDVENPALTCPANINANNDPGVCGAGVSYGAATATDNCPGVISFQTGGLASGSTFPVGISQVSFTAVDASGNNTSCSFNITVSDVENPVITCPADIIQSNDLGLCAAAVSYPGATATDNCPGVISFQTGGLPSGSSFTVGTHSVAFTAVDASGNNTSCSFSITVNDDEDPIITCPADITLSCQDQIQPADANDASATDNCDNNPVLTVVEVSNGGSGCGSNPLILTRTYTATDLYGNSASCSQTISVVRDSVLMAGNSDRPCMSEVTASLDCSNENCLDVSSTKDLSNVVLMDICGNEYKFDDLNQGLTGTFCHPSGLPIATVWIKSGCYMSGDGPGYGWRLDFCQPVACPNKYSQGEPAAPFTEFMAYPNPFKASTNIRLLMNQDDNVSLEVFNLNGTRIAQIYKGAIEANKAYEFDFNAEGVTAGVYLAKMVATSGEIKFIRLVIAK